MSHIRFTTRHVGCLGLLIVAAGFLLGMYDFSQAFVEVARATDIRSTFRATPWHYHARWSRPGRCCNGGSNRQENFPQAASTTLLGHDPGNAPN